MKQRKGSIIGGLIMIVVGGLFLLGQLFPGVSEIVDISRQWPLLIVGVGGFFLISSLLGTPSLAVPGVVIAGIGGILYYQNLTGDWASWAYIWALIPGFAGLGTLVMGLLRQQDKAQMREGLRLVVISAVLFAVFWAFFNGLGAIGNYWPVLLILLGGWLLIQSRRRA